MLQLYQRLSQEVMDSRQTPGSSRLSKMSLDKTPRKAPASAKKNKQQVFYSDLTRQGLCETRQDM